MSELIDDAGLALLTAGHCPDCAHRGFVLGPRGGSGLSVECAAIPCRARFVIVLSPVGPPGSVVLAQPVDRESAGGGTWTNSPGWER
jgi:hypothetical protein